jgi:hypothetical protein
VCALNAPSQCDEQRLQFVSQGSLMQCMMQAPPALYRPVVGPPSGDARHAMAMRLPWRPEDLINESDHRVTTHGAEPVSARRSEGSPCG